MTRHRMVFISCTTDPPTPGADPEGVRGVQTNPPGHLRLHIVCAYLGGLVKQWFWPEEPSLTKILASRVVLKGAFTHLGKIWDPQISSCCKLVLTLTTGEYARKWAWFRQSGHGFKIFARALRAFEPPYWKSWIRPWTLSLTASLGSPFHLGTHTCMTLCMHTHARTHTHTDSTSS